MTYLISEIALYLGAAAVIGFLTGWLAQEPRRRASMSSSSGPVDAEAGASEDTNEQLEWLTTRMEEQERESNETIGRMASEIEQLRPLLESLSHGVEASARDTNTDRESRERAEQSARELDEIKHKFKQLATEHEKLQTNYDKVADRVVGYEKERLAGGLPKPPRRPKQENDLFVEPAFGVKPTPSARPAPSAKPDLPPEPRSKPIPSPVIKKASRSLKKELLFDHLPVIERSGEPVITGVVDLDDLEILERHAKPAAASSVEFEAPESPEAPEIVSFQRPIADAEPAPKPQSVAGGMKGMARSLDLVPSIPDDVIARMAVIGLKTNLDLLRKCATRGGLNALSMSMGLDMELLAQWTAAADLLRLECVRRDDIPALIDVGIDSVESLATSSADELSKQLHRSRKSRDKAPAEAVTKWIDEAKGLAAIVQA